MCVWRGSHNKLTDLFKLKALPFGLQSIPLAMLKLVHQGQIHLSKGKHVYSKGDVMREPNTFLSVYWVLQSVLDAFASHLFLITALEERFDLFFTDNKAKVQRNKIDLLEITELSSAARIKYRSNTGKPVILATYHSFNSCCKNI